MNRNLRSRRQGIVSLWAIIVLTIVGTLTVLLTVQGLAQRRITQQREQQLQAYWLARSGFELASQRLLANPSGYEGETVELIPQSQVKITVAAVKDRSSTYRVTSEARYPTDRPNGILLTQTRILQRSSDKDQARISVLNEGD